MIRVTQHTNGIKSKPVIFLERINAEQFISKKVEKMDVLTMKAKVNGKMEQMLVKVASGETHEFSIFTERS